MAEETSTGGLKKFVYGKGHQPQLDAHRKQEIKEAYQRYHIRVEKEKQQRLIVFAVIIFLVLVGISLYFSFR